MMATNTYVALDTKTISSASTSVEFTSVPQGYTDLILVANISTVSDGEGISFQVGNGTIDTNTNYSRTVISGANDTNVASFRQSNQSNVSMQYAIGVGSNQPSTYQIHFMNYSNTANYKTFLVNASTSRGTSTGKKEIMKEIALWRSTSAINTIKLTTTVNMNVGSTFALYGVADSNIGAPKAFGGTITQDATYTYHAFGASGTFTPTQSLTADILVIGGGGGGGRIVAGGGGAGGLLGFSSQSLTATAYTVTVGSGGAGASASGYAAGTTGGDSSFGGLTLVKGGGGGGHINNNGLNGGSGGGGGGAISGATQTGGSPTSGQGFAGGTATGNTSQYIGAGGGGAGGAGGANTSSTPGVGGIGVSTYSDWGLATGTGQNVAGTIYYAGGGAGGWSSPNGSVVNIAYGGLGGGGNGGWSRTNDSQDNPATVGLANTGGGGGGAGNDASGANANSSGKNGGSGLVIIRYAN
jgi:hypothetical protein